MTNLCAACTEVRDNARLFPMPRHVIHAEHGRPNVWSVHCEAICPDCGTGCGGTGAITRPRS